MTRGQIVYVTFAVLFTVLGPLLALGGLALGLSLFYFGLLAFLGFAFWSRPWLVATIVMAAAVFATMHARTLGSLLAGDTGGEPAHTALVSGLIWALAASPAAAGIAFGVQSLIDWDKRRSAEIETGVDTLQFG